MKPEHVFLILAAIYLQKAAPKWVCALMSAFMLGLAILLVLTK